jgi:hypothetical protein
MKLESYSLDDLHQLALNEFDDDEVAIAFLNQFYADLQREYREIFQHLRDLRQERHG